jgi:hypothetical protein
MKKTLIAGGAGLLLFLGACSKDPDKSDFKKQTADFINKNGGQVEEQLGTTFDGAKCDEPASTAVGTKYQCTATAADGTAYTFDVEITSKNGFTVQDANAAGAASTAPADTTLDTTTTTA